ncbi:MAG: alpha-L-rhamnosidase, partial [Bacteroidales bacterium]|nr:alpha-L-rhamnosidase [Bacteroidales bacterium]
KPYLREGKNVIACEVLFYGTGDGTHPMGKPGFLFNADLDDFSIISDNTWKCHLARSWKPGQYKRWFLRALQEDFDARLYPYGWNDTLFQENNSWLAAQKISDRADKPSICTSYTEYQWDISSDTTISQIRKRSVPAMREYCIPAYRLRDKYRIDWLRSPEEYFDMLTPHSFRLSEKPLLLKQDSNTYTVEPCGDKGAVLTFEFKEQGVGWPYFTIDAPEGTIVEMLVHEGHNPENRTIINSHFNSWSRFTCKEGENVFEPFDFESFRWLQLHIRNFDRAVKIKNIGMRRRVYPWKQVPVISVSDDTLQHIIDASINTLNNSAQEIIVDGMARERQQYSGDGGHQLHPIFQVFGEQQLPFRYINTFSQGSSIEGYFMDCWPAWDRLARVAERQMGLTGWGPIIDHGIGFNFDTFFYYLYTGDKEGLNEVYPRLVKFFHYLVSLTKEGLIPGEDIGLCSVYIDHQAYKKQRHKELALNLYTATMCRHALAPLCRLFNDEATASKAERYADRQIKVCIDRFWSKDKRTFVCNLPWADEENELRYCDRSLSLALLYHLCPNDDTERSLDILANMPRELGTGYPCNSVWHYWALAENGRMDVVIGELKEKWGKMLSVWENNTLQEFFHSTHDNNSQWSHCPVAPLVMLYQGVAGAKPLDTGGNRYRIWPQPDILTYVKFPIHTQNGIIGFESKEAKGKRVIRLDVPKDCEIELWLDKREKVKFPGCGSYNNLNKYLLKGGKNYTFHLRYM